MKTNFNKVIEHLQKEELSSAEKGYLKMEVLRNIREAGYKPVVSPWSGVFVAFRTHTVAFVTAVTIIFTGGGFAFAAEGALPGEPLYTLKVSFNEEVRDAISLHPSQKAQWSAEKARRRLQEAETLSNQGRLSEAIETDLQNRFIEHAIEAREAMASLEKRQNLVGLMEAASSLESVLSAHKSLIDPSSREGESIALQARTQKEFSDLREKEAKVGITTTLSESEEDDSLPFSSSAEDDSAEPMAASLEASETGAEDSFLKIIEESLEVVSKERERAEEGLSLVSEASLKNAAHRMERKAEIRGKITNALFAKIKKDISLENKEYAERELFRFSELMSMGREKIDESGYSSALTLYNQASKSMNSLEIFLNSLVTASKIKEKQARDEVGAEPEQNPAVEEATTTTEEELPVAGEASLVEDGGEAEGGDMSTTSSSTASERGSVGSLGSRIERALKGN